MILPKILGDYCTASRQKVNLTKSAIQFSPRTKLQVKHVIREQLGTMEQIAYGPILEYLSWADGFGDLSA